MYVFAVTLRLRWPTNSPIRAQGIPRACSSEILRCRRSCGDQSGIAGGLARLRDRGPERVGARAGEQARVRVAVLTRAESGLQSLGRAPRAARPIAHAVSSSSPRAAAHGGAARRSRRRACGRSPTTRAPDQSRKRSAQPVLRRDQPVDGLDVLGARRVRLLGLLAGQLDVDPVAGRVRRRCRAKSSTIASAVDALADRLARLALAVEVARRASATSSGGDRVDRLGRRARAARG